MPAMYDFKGYKLTVRDDRPQPVAVFDPRFPAEPALYKTTSLDEAMRWVSAYRDGAQWAVAALDDGYPAPGEEAANGREH